MRRNASTILTMVAVLVAVLEPVGAVGADSVATLVDIRATHLPGIDRLVFEFEGGRPSLGAAAWSTTPPTLDPSGLPSAAQGNAFLTVVFQDAVGHLTVEPFTSTYGPARRAYALPNVAHLVTIGDWESVMTLTIGVMKRPEFVRVRSLVDPPRWIVELGTSFPKTTIETWFLDRDLLDGPPPYLVPVSRLIPETSGPHSAMHRLFAGPTIAERQADLRFRRSGATDWTDLRISDTGVARIRLVGGCDSYGETITIANEIRRTLKQFPQIDYVKVYDPAGTTLYPTGLVDSIPACLLP